MNSATQDDLFDPKRLARSSDHWTSKRAAEEIVPELSSLRREVLRLVKEYPGSIARELTDIAGHRDERKVGRRLSELERMDLVRRGEERRCAVTGRQCSTWWPK